MPVCNASRKDHIGSSNIAEPYNMKQFSHFIVGAIHESPVLQGIRECPLQPHFHFIVGHSVYDVPKFVDTLKNPPCREDFLCYHHSLKPTLKHFLAGEGQSIQIVFFLVQPGGCIVYKILLGITVDHR